MFLLNEQNLKEYKEELTTNILININDYLRVLVHFTRLHYNLIKLNLERPKLYTKYSVYFINPPFFIYKCNSNKLKWNVKYYDFTFDRDQWMFSCRYHEELHHDLMSHDTAKFGLNKKLLYWRV